MSAVKVSGQWRQCEYNTRRSNPAANQIGTPTRLRGGRAMDRRRTWRAQEQQLVERWNAATERCRQAEAEVSRQRQLQGAGAPSEECLRSAEAARVELEAMRKLVARMKVEFSTGKRY
ncbi:MAG: hypothetical protein ACTS6J_06945 [Burkholderiales bacterium]